MTDPSTRLERAIEQLGAEHEPPPGWQAKVLAAVAPKPRRWFASRWWFAVPAVAAIAIGVVLVPWHPEPPPLVVSAELVAPAFATRGGNGEIHAAARGGTGNRALWVYRDRQELVAACPGHAACRTADGALRLDVAIDRSGRYQVLALSAAGPLPVPSGSYEIDLAAAIDAKAEWKLHELATP
jgi:hypothetical protein